MSSLKRPTKEVQEIYSKIGELTLRQSAVLSEWYKELLDQQHKKEINIPLFPIWNLLDDINTILKEKGYKGVDLK